MAVINKCISCRVLQIEEPATEKEIKEAYRRLVKKWHPDRNPDDSDAEARFKENAEVI